jgi:hypothetical protein
MEFCQCRRTSVAPTINGLVDCEPWNRAEWSPRFVDMATGAPGWWDTRAAALWDDEALYVAFRVEEPFVRADLTERDSLIFQENDVELFIDGGDCYYELEVNARNTLYEVFFVWKDSPLPERPEYDPRRRNALTFGGDYDRRPESFWRGTHPRGPRWAYLDWDFPGLRSAVHVDGTLNDDTDIDRGWSVTLALPWAGMKELANGRALPPEPGDEWRMFFGRFQKLESAGKEVQPHPAWCWTAHGVYDTHMPERFTRVRFVG